ncbi:MAG: alpha/beta fold hydrolase [Halodesulfovibrio sp.]
MMKISDLKFGIPVAPRREEAVPEGKAVAGSVAGASPQEAASLESLFRAVAMRHPERVALACDEGSMTFAELEAFSAAVARFIAARFTEAGECGQEVVVGVLCRRGSLYLAAALGIMRAGAVYLPVERELPAARQEVMLEPARLIITDSHCLREAESLRYRLPNLPQILCIDAGHVAEVREKGTELSSTAYWEHVTEAAPDMGWMRYLHGDTFPAGVLTELAASILAKGCLAGKAQRRVLDIGSGAGVVARELCAAATSYTAVELSRIELDRLEKLPVAGDVKLHQMGAEDIRFLEGAEYDLIVLNGVVENFPGYNYLRRVLDHAVGLLAPDGILLVGAVRDLAKRESFRETLKELLREPDSLGAPGVSGASGMLGGTGDAAPDNVADTIAGDMANTTRRLHAGLLRLDASEELWLPERFFTEWAAESSVPVSVEISRTVVADVELSDFRFDVAIRKTGSSAPACNPVRFGAESLDAVHDRGAGSPLPVCRPEQAAYIVYTSGSTGIPKGVVVEHRHLMHILRALKPLSGDTRHAALVAPLSFDASIQQIAVSLFCGNPLYILSDAERKNPAALCECARKHGIDLCDMTPAFFNVLVEYLAERNQPLPMSRLLLAGEILRPDTIRKFYAVPGNENVVLYNVYGPTECTVDTTAFRIDSTNYRDFSAYPIGYPLEGCEVTIRDRRNMPLPDSVTGEIWISGAGVSRGYRNVPEPNAFTVMDGERCYRTGDYGYTRGGLLFYMGREDQQVKIRGNRVELGEVENAIAGFPGVKQVAVIADIFRTGEEKTLAAYVVGNVDGNSLREYLGQLLPSFCVPAYVVPMVELPFNINRKVDRKALPSPLGSGNMAVNGRRPHGPVEEALAAIWHRLLGVEITDAEASFFNLGGHSILAVRLIALIEKELHVHLSVSELFANPTIAGLTSLFAGKAAVQESPVIKLCHCEGGKSIFLFHPVGGSVFCYSALAELLSHKFTVYAVEAAGFRSERNTLNTELHRVENLASYYLDEILKVETKNIIFGGWSFGGLLAYETACRFGRMGGQTGNVLVLDSVADNSKAKQMAAKDDMELLKWMLQDALDFDEAVLRSLPREEKLAYLVSCGEKTGLLPFGFSSAQMANLLHTYRSNAIAAARYDNPTRSERNILLIRALDYSSNPMMVDNDIYQGWSAFLSEENITLKWTEGTHESMLSPGLAGNIANHILEYLSHE